MIGARLHRVQISEYHSSSVKGAEQGAQGENRNTGGKSISDVEHFQGLQNKKDFPWSVKQTLPTKCYSISPPLQWPVAVVTSPNGTRKKK